MEGLASSFSIVVPWLPGILGHRDSLNLARELSTRGARVDYLVGRIPRDYVDSVKSQLGDARLTTLGFVESPGQSIRKWARFQYSRNLDREIARAIATAHKASPYDVVLVHANEGHWVAAYIRRLLPERRPWLAVCVRELVENPFWLGYERPWPLTRRLLSPLYPLFHDSELERLNQFDQVYAISPWTSILLDYFYGIRRAPTLAMVDRTFFDIPIRESPREYVAVPTVALDSNGIRLVRKIAGAVPNLRTYGPRQISGVPHAGFLSDAHLAPFLESAAVTLFVFDYEALGLIPLESLATGTPVATIPKQGPRHVLSGNPGARFGATSGELSTAIAELSEKYRDVARRQGLRESVRAFHPANATNDFLANLTPRSEKAELSGMRRQRTS